MLESVLAVLFDAVIEIVLQVVGEVAVDATIKRTDGTRAWYADNPLLTAIGLMLLGGLWGGLTFLVVPYRVLPVPPISGLSLVLSPIASGLVMHALGHRRRRQGQKASPLLTFGGGALFALACAATRFTLLGKM